MKVILASNFDSDSYNEEHLTNPYLHLNEATARAIAEAYDSENAAKYESCPDIARVVPDNYVLQKRKA